MHVDRFPILRTCTVLSRKQKMFVHAYCSTVLVGGCSAAVLRCCSAAVCKGPVHVGGQTPNLPVSYH